jgi:hypothetical protein
MFSRIKLVVVGWASINQIILHPNHISAQGFFFVFSENELLRTQISFLLNYCTSYTMFRRTNTSRIQLIAIRKIIVSTLGFIGAWMINTK